MLHYRTTLEEIGRHYPSMEAVFEDGNYTYVAAFAKDSELKGCAYIMLGHPEKGIEILDSCGCNTERSLSYRAIGYWFLGNDSRCLSLLDQVLEKNPYCALSGGLRRLLGKKRIKVLVFNKEFDTKALLCDERFDIVTVGRSCNDDIRIRFDEGGDVVMSRLERMQWTPDFLFVFRPEYLVLPQGLELLPFPKIAFCSDYDLHLYQRYNCFKKFDKLVVYSSVDHFESQRLFDRSVYTHIFAVAASKLQPDNAKSEKKYDIVLTGSSFKTFFADKSILISALTALDPKYHILVNDGFVSRQKYEQWMQQARVVPTFVRFYGCFPTRGIEALAVGATVLYPDQGVLELFVEKGNGVFPYGSTSLPEDAEKAIAQSQQFSHASISRDLEIFAPTRSVGQFFKFCSVISVLPSRENGKMDHCERDDLSVVGFHTLHGTTAAGLTAEQVAAHFTEMIAHNKGLDRSKHSVNSTAIGYVYLRQHVDRDLLYVSAAARDLMIEQAVSTLREGVGEFPDALVLYFNLGRILFHFKDKDAAFEIFDRMLSLRHSLKLDDLQDDIMSGMFFFDGYFPYRDYVDAIVNRKMGKERDDDPSPQAIVFSGVHYYLALIHEGKGLISSALASANDSLACHPGNFITKRLMVRLLRSDYKATGFLAQLPLLIRYHEESTAAYSRYIHPDILWHAEALAALERYEELKAALCRWFLFFKRIREDCEVLPLDLSFVNGILSFSGHLPDEGRLMFEKIDAFVRGGRGTDFSQLEEEVIFKLYKTENRLEELAAAIAAGRYTPSKGSFGSLKIAVHLTRWSSAPKAVPFYLRHLRETGYFGWGSDEGLKWHEIIEFISVVTEKSPRLFQLARYVYHVAKRLRFPLRIPRHP